MGTLEGSVELLYDVFAGYSFTSEPWVCPQCAPELTAADVANRGLRSLSLAHLGALHVMTLDDGALRHVFPRLMELLLRTPAPVFDFRVSDVKARISEWSGPERAAARQLAEAVWTELLGHYPAELGYFSDCPSALDLLDWCGIPATSRLDDMLSTDGFPPAAHLADLVDAVLTLRYPFETASREEVQTWIGKPEVGERLQEAFFSASADEPASRFSAAHQLWTACAWHR